MDRFVCVYVCVCVCVQSIPREKRGVPLSWELSRCRTARWLVCRALDSVLAPWATMDTLHRSSLHRHTL